MTKVATQATQPPQRKPPKRKAPKQRKQRKPSQDLEPYSPPLPPLDPEACILQLQLPSFRSPFRCRQPLLEFPVPFPLPSNLWRDVLGYVGYDLRALFAVNQAMSDHKQQCMPYCYWSGWGCAPKRTSRARSLRPQQNY